MKRKMLILACVICLSISSVSYASAEDNTIRSSNEWIQVYDNYIQDDMFQRELQDSSDTALDMIDNIVAANNRIITYAGPLREPSCTVPLIKQKEYNYCGPASVLQALSGIGVSSSVSGSTTDAKQVTLAGNMGTSSPNGTLVYRVKNELNNYVSSYQYTYETGISSSSTLLSKIGNSLFYDRPVLLHANTKYLDYYEGHESGHYIVVDKAYMTVTSGSLQNYIRVQDCNNQSAYYGTHTVHIDQVLSAINGRYLIYAP